MLHFCKLNNENNLLSHSLAKLCDDMRADSEKLPSTSASSSKHNDEILKKAELLFEDSLHKYFNELVCEVTLK